MVGSYVVPFLIGYFISTCKSDENEERFPEDPWRAGQPVPSMAEY